ncbi:MAG: NYN domain-containing protein, partial [Chloroflexi bacterium]|nr:NYN domain-containing protein [Chloroflexota bacterium]
KFDGSREQQEFLETLRKTPYLELRLGNTKLSQGIPVERGIDVMLATDLLYFAANNSYDIAILVSGDSDFGYTLGVVKNMGKHIEVAYFDNAASRDLLNSADYLHPLDTKFFTGLWTTGVRQYAHRRKAPRYRKINAVPVINAAGTGEQITPQDQPPSPDSPISPVE